MIETIYNSESNEEETIRLPKNIHQIGSGETKYHIYIEDKVSEFLKLLPENEKEIRYGVLLGNVKFSRGEMYLFVRAAVEVREVLDNTLLFGDDVWTGIYEDIKKYYHGEKIIGWYTSVEDFRERDLFHMRKIHLDHFAGNDKVFLNIDREETELDFYVYQNGDLQKVKCYHIYYEKNQELESYIFETHYNLTSKRKSIRTRAAQTAQPEKKEEGQEEIQGQNQAEEEAAAGKQEEKRRDNDAYRKLMLFSGKAASFFAVGALVFTIGVMYKKGQLDNLRAEMQEVVANIMNKNESTDLDDVIILDDKKGKETTVGTEHTTALEETEVLEETAAQEETTAPEVQTEQQTQPESTQEETAAVLPATTKHYEVQKGDTLYGICKKLYGNVDNMEIIMKLNNLDSADSITYGKTLIIP